MVDTNYHVYVNECHIDCPILGYETRIASGTIRIDTYEGDNKVRADAYDVLAISEADIEAVVTELGRINCSLDFTQLTKFIRNECDTLVVHLPGSPDGEIVTDDHYLALVRIDNFTVYQPHFHKTVLAHAVSAVCDPHARVVNAKLPCNKYHWTRVCALINKEINL